MSKTKFKRIPKRALHISGLDMFVSVTLRDAEELRKKAISTFDFIPYLGAPARRYYNLEKGFTYSELIDCVNLVGVSDAENIEKR